MTNTTQCPACQTRFKVSAAQLSAADGLVRCGRCAHVFNANDYFVSSPAPAAVTPPPAAPEPAPVAPESAPDIDDFELEVPDFDPLTASLPEDPLPEYPEEIGTIESEDGPSSADVEAFQQALNQAMQGNPVSTPIGNPFSEFDPEPVTPAASAPETPLEESLEDDVVPAIFDTRRTVAPAQAEEEVEVSPPEIPAEPLYDPAIGNEAPAKKRSPYITILALLLALVGLLLLAGQLVYINRTLIASQAPELRPTLELACKQLGCKIPLPKDQEYIRTEWSELSFVPEHTNLVQLSATLKNHAPYPQAFPVLEVTLKDADNQVLIRKVFSPKEYLKPENQKATSFAANTEVKLTMRFDVGKVHAQGYSLYWFYP